MNSSVDATNYHLTPEPVYSRVSYPSPDDVYLKPETVHQQHANQPTPPPHASTTVTQASSSNQSANSSVPQLQGFDLENSGFEIDVLPDAVPLVQVEPLVPLEQVEPLIPENYVPDEDFDPVGTIGKSGRRITGVLAYIGHYKQVNGTNVWTHDEVEYEYEDDDCDNSNYYL